MTVERQLPNFARVLLASLAGLLFVSAGYATAKTPAKPYDLDDAHLLTPFWKSKTVYGETVLFVQDKEGEPADGTLLFEPARILRARNARTGEIYELGRDFVYDSAKKRLVLTGNSRIPFLKTSDLFKPKNSPHAVKHKAGDPDTWLMYQEAGFQDKQVELDYERTGNWDGYTPKFAGDQLPRVIAKLKAKQPVRIAVVGDSISAGANASSTHYPPHQPSYSILVVSELEKVYGAKVELLNLGTGGTMANGAVTKLDQVMAFHPDLLLIAYGMNDVATHNAKKFGEYVQAILTAVQAKLPETEFLLVASCRANPVWNWSPAEQFAPYRDALAKLTGPHIAMVDLTTLWTQMMDHKRYYDLTGNGINHPNDFGHRLYAQAILSLLIGP
jgi:lysophospholipase L1-like esterase